MLRIPFRFLMVCSFRPGDCSTTPNDSRVADDCLSSQRPLELMNRYSPNRRRRESSTPSGVCPTDTARRQRNSECCARTTSGPHLEKDSTREYSYERQRYPPQQRPTWQREHVKPTADLRRSFGSSAGDRAGRPRICRTVRRARVTNPRRLRYVHHEPNRGIGFDRVLAQRATRRHRRGPQPRTADGKKRATRPLGRVVGSVGSRAQAPAGSSEKTSARAGSKLRYPVIGRLSGGGS
jgi:hypothetical protein